MATTVAPLFAWLPKNFPSLSACQIAKNRLGPFVCCGKCNTFTLGWSADGDVDHENVCVCHTHCL
jgi:hypothetical protein